MRLFLDAYNPMMMGSLAQGDAVEVYPLRSDEDVVRIRKIVRDHTVRIGMSLVDQTKTITAASELARNTLRYGGGGDARIEQVQDGARQGVRISFIDQGPGIADITLALTDGYTTGGGLGLGLGGTKRLTDEMTIDSAPGRGTTVTMTKWRNR